MTKLSLCPISLDEANAFVARLHRHHEPVQGHKFSLGAMLGRELMGVAIVGRPVSRIRDDGDTLEVTRLCTVAKRAIPGKLNRKGEQCFHNPTSFLYGAALRATFALGYRRLGTYTLPSEGGASLRACGWKLIGERGGGSWNCPSRPRTDTHPTGPKLLWEIAR
ncbi:XF1762 family protein [Azospirillum sp. B506]|uniref:XF1762 family protein n=1 Tax=Azospirillum sp. B506 TaxID=137721 RepID=UPI0005B25CCF|nr:XF1762 family protein [Azospirillum sp. B506]